MKPFWKGLVMTIITYLFTSFASGFPHAALQWEVTGITLVGTLCGYFAQSVMLPTTSIQGDWNWRDLLKGSLVALSNFLSSAGANYAAGTHINIWALLGGAGGVLFGYLSKQLVTKPAK